MTNHTTYLQEICQAMGAQSVADVQLLQELWSGYGSLERVTLQHADGTLHIIIVKRITAPQDLDAPEHPRGWQTDISHQRKMHSYQVEHAWYQTHAHTCPLQSRVAKCLATHCSSTETWLVLEDLGQAGYSARITQASLSNIQACLCWLAYFHAQFIYQGTENPYPKLWKQGSYWHLGTRPDEWQNMQDGPLKQAAEALDHALRQDTYPTLLHGDAKLANFCFSPDGTQVAAVDFQYIGRGCAMSDIAYLLSSALDEQQLIQHADALLDTYFQYLRQALQQLQPHIDATDLIATWRLLYPIAWADFSRFLQGWCPDHWKLHGYTLSQTRIALSQL